jgi:hypothetical protein
MAVRRPVFAVILLIGLLSSCVPRVMEIPDYLYGTPVEEDIRREILRSRRPVRIITADTARELSRRTALFFPASGNEQERTRLVPGKERDDALEAALQWILRDREAPAILAFSPAAFTDDPMRLGTVERGEATVVLLDRPGESALAVQSILSAVGAAGDGIAGIVILAGEHTPAIARTLLQREREGDLIVIPELFLPASGVRMRAAGIPLAGAIVHDLAGTLRRLPLRHDGTGDIHVQMIFFRY